MNDNTEKQGEETMESMTKNRQDKAVLGRMVEKVFAPVEMTGYQELTEGYYNVAYALTLSDGREVILKVAPRPDVRIMSYERNIMRSEVDAMLLQTASGMPIL